jgi:hypothetical protein
MVILFFMQLPIMSSQVNAPIGSATINGVNGHPPFFAITKHVFTLEIHIIIHLKK